MDLKDSDPEITTKRKKRQRGSSIVEKDDKVFRLQYEEDYAEGYISKLYKELDERVFSRVLSIIANIESNAFNIKEQYDKIEEMLKDRPDLLWELLGFLEPYQALECGKLMNYYELCSMKQFVRNLLSHFKRQPHLLRKMIDKLCELAELEGVQRESVEEDIAPLLQKNSILMQQFLKLLPVEKPPEWYFSTDDIWEDCNIESEITNEEILDITMSSDNVNLESQSCIYDCKENSKISMCPVCNLKFINGRMYVANGRMLRPANLIFDPSEEAENTKRLTEKYDYFPPLISRNRSSKRVDTNKESNEGSYSPFIIGTESEEELGENDVPQRKRRSTERLKVRFNKKKPSLDLNQIDDTTASDVDGCYEDGCKDDDNGMEFNIFPSEQFIENTSCKIKEIVNMENVELNITSRSLEKKSC